MAPANCITKKARALQKEVCPEMMVAVVTAGLRWPPDTLAVTKTALRHTHPATSPPRAPVEKVVETTVLFRPAVDAGVAVGGRAGASRGAGRGRTEDGKDDAVGPGRQAGGGGLAVQREESHAPELRQARRDEAGGPHLVLLRLQQPRHRAAPRRPRRPGWGRAAHPPGVARDEMRWRRTRAADKGGAGAGAGDRGGGGGGAGAESSSRAGRAGGAVVTPRAQP